MNPIRVGTTGPRTGALGHSIETLVETMFWLDPSEFHHGDCIGWDAEAHDAVRAALPWVRIVVHPPKNPKYRAWKMGETVKPPKGYLIRNRNIVNETHLLIAPAYGGSGTNYTKKYAKDIDRGVSLV